MFDKHIHQATGIHHVEVTERRAPTDESVKLLRELEMAAQDKINSVVRVKDTAFECVVRTSSDFMNDRELLAAQFSMNGKRILVNTHVDNPATEEQAAMALMKELSERIAVEMLAPIFHKAWRNK